MYPTKQRVVQRLTFLSRQLEVLYEEKRALNRNLSLLEKEKEILNNLLDIYSIEGGEEWTTKQKE